MYSREPGGTVGESRGTTTSMMFAPDQDNSLFGRTFPDGTREDSRLQVEGQARFVCHWDHYPEGTIALPCRLQSNASSRAELAKQTQDQVARILHIAKPHDGADIVQEPVLRKTIRTTEYRI